VRPIHKLTIVTGENRLDQSRMRLFATDSESSHKCVIRQMDLWFSEDSISNLITFNRFNHPQGAAQLPLKSLKVLDCLD
jgi:hypothetical protein